MIIDLKGRKAIVTGSTAGIGRATAEGLVRAGAAVVVDGRRAARVDEALRQIRQAVPGSHVSGVAADMATPEGVEALIAQVPAADILVNDMGTAYLRPQTGIEDIAKIPDEDRLSLFQLIVMSGVRASRRHLPGMVRRGWGRVVFVSSAAAVNIPKEMLDYGMTRTAQLAVSRDLAEAVAGVTVNAVLPGSTRSEILGELMAQGLTQDQAEQPFLEVARPTNLLGRFAMTDEVADMIVYTGSERVSATSGAALRVDGGVTRQGCVSLSVDGDDPFRRATALMRGVASGDADPAISHVGPDGFVQQDPGTADGVADHLAGSASKMERSGRAEAR